MAPQNYGIGTSVVNPEICPKYHRMIHTRTGKNKKYLIKALM